MKKFMIYLMLLFGFVSFAAAEQEITHLYLIRNGQTPRNALGFVQGQEEVPDSQLNEDGQMQAEHVGVFLKKQHPNLSHKIYASPLGRGYDTAKLATKNFSNVRIIKKGDLKEIDHGKHDGTDKQLRNMFYQQYYEREIFKQRVSHPGQPIDPYFKWKVNPLAGAETCLSMCQRALKALNEIGEENLGEEVAVFTHGAVIEALITHLKHQQGKLSEELLPLWYEKPCMHNCAVAHFLYDSNPSREEERIIFLGFEQ